MAWNLVDKVISCLEQHPEQRLIAREIAEWIFNTHPNDCSAKQARSTATVVPIDNQQSFITQIVAEIGSHRQRLQRKEPKIKTTEDYPRKYYYTEFTDSAEVEQAEDTSTTAANNTRTKEHYLYPILTQFLESELEIESWRIDEKRSKNTRGAGGNKWLYPDLVGMEDLSQDWDREIKDCVKEYADKKTRLWSFEVKILINRSNVREVFFQAVSNSSWANFGYLVAGEIETNTLKELRILSSLHGIGFIRLAAKENIADSQIIIPAKERSYVDWDTANRLAKENKDFLNYIKEVRKFYQTGEVHQR